jgi:hypothetical protein
MDQYDSPALEDAADLYDELREQRSIEILQQGLLDSTYLDSSRQGPPLSEDEYLDVSGD